MDIGTTLLEYGADTDAVTRQGISPIHLAAQEGSVDLVSLLLAKNANVNVCNKVHALMAPGSHDSLRHAPAITKAVSHAERTHATPPGSPGGQNQCCRSSSQQRR